MLALSLLTTACGHATPERSVTPDRPATPEARVSTAPSTRGELLIGCAHMAEGEGGEEVFAVALFDGGVDDRPPPSRPAEQFMVELHAGSLDLRVRSAIRVPFANVALAGFGGSCEQPISRASELYSMPDEEAGAAAHRFTALFIPSWCGEDPVVAIAGANVRVHRLDSGLTALPPGLSPVVAGIDRATEQRIREGGDPVPPPVAPQALSLEERGLVFVRGRYGNEFVLRGRDVVFDAEIFVQEAKAIVEAGPRTFILIENPSGTAAIDLATGRAACVN